jgi:hypothetical protein
MSSQRDNLFPLFCSQDITYPTEASCPQLRLMSKAFSIVRFEGTLHGRFE